MMVKLETQDGRAFWIEQGGHEVLIEQHPTFEGDNMQPLVLIVSRAGARAIVKGTMDEVYSQLWGGREVVHHTDSNSVGFKPRRHESIPLA